MIRCKAIDTQFLCSNKFVSLVNGHPFEFVALRQPVVGVAGWASNRSAFVCGFRGPRRSLFTLSCIVLDVVMRLPFATWKVYAFIVVRDFTKDGMIGYSRSRFNELCDIPLCIMGSTVSRHFILRLNGNLSTIFLMLSGFSSLLR